MGRLLRLEPDQMNARNRRIGDTARSADDARVSTRAGPSGTWEPRKNERPELISKRVLSASKSPVTGCGDSPADTIDHRLRLTGVSWHEIRLRTSSSNDRFVGVTGAGLAYASRASHSRSFDHRLRVRFPFTAIANAFRCPTRKTTR